MYAETSWCGYVLPALTDFAFSVVKSHLTPGAAANPNAQLEDLRRLKNALSGLLIATQSNFQSNVIANYTEFIQVSKDIAALESEMLELKSVLEEWKTVPEGLAVEQSFDAAAPSQNGGFAHASGAKVNRRNSLADLQALYRTQLETLWEAVEGAQRFLPMTPGRHVLGRHAGWIELNSATYRPRQQVILILLNDALLVAIEKRRQMGGATRIVADRCFILNEIAVTDLRDTGGGPIFRALCLRSEWHSGRRHQRYPNQTRSRSAHIQE